MSRTFLLCIALLALAGTMPAGAEGPAPGVEIDALPHRPSPGERLDEIRRRVQASVVYPERARRLGLEGTTRIQFRVGASGLAEEVSAVESSGHAELDAAALRGAAEAGRLPRLAGWIRIPVEFRLAGPG